MANMQQRKFTISANGMSTPNLNVGEYRTLSVDISGTFVGTLQFEGSVDGTNWRTIPYLNVSTGTINFSGNTSAVGLLTADVSALQYVRIRSTAWTSGSAVLASFVSPTGSLNLATVPTSSGTNTVNTQESTKLTGTTYNLTTAASTNAASVKASAGNLFELTVSNPTATAAYVKLYNKASAPTVGTDTPVLTIPVPATAAGVGLVSLNFGAQGKRFATGIAIAVTAAAAATDTAVTVAGIQINGTYI